MIRSELDKVLEALRARVAECERDGVSTVYLATGRGSHEEFVIKANACGLVHLAVQLLELAERPANHIHLDEASELEECWKPVVIAHVQDPW